MIQSSSAPGPEDAWRTQGLPVVSVVIATHNRPELLREAIARALEQTYAGRIEVIVVFDKSQPEYELEQRSPLRSIQVISNTHTPGLAGARNSGIACATGEYVAFCDDDDDWLPEKVKAQVEMAQETGADTVVSGIVILYQNKRTVRIPHAADLEADNLAKHRVMEAHMSSVLVRRHALLESIGTINEELPGSYGEDFEWILRAARHGPIAVVEAPLVRVRWGQSLFSNKWATIVEAIDHLLESDTELSHSPEGLARLKGRRAFALAAMGRGKLARHSALESLRLNARERRAYLAVAVSLRLISANRLMHWAHSRGRGI